MFIRLTFGVLLTTICLRFSFAQDQSQVKELYGKIEIGTLLPSVNGLEKLTDEEKEKLKATILDLYRLGFTSGYKAGGEYVSKSVQKEVNEFIIRMDADDSIRPGSNGATNNRALKDSKLKKGLRVFLTGLVADAEGYTPSQQNNPRPTYTASPQPVPASARKYVKKIIDRGQYVLLDDGSLWEVNSLDKLTSSTWASYDDIIIVRSGFETRLLNTRDDKSVTARRVK